MEGGTLTWPRGIQRERERERERGGSSDDSAMKD